MRILIVDPEYLVAMEAERILGERLECEIQIAMPRNYPGVLESQNFDLVLVDTSLIQSPEAERRLSGTGAAIVFSSLVGDETGGLSGWPGVAVVAKPFDDQQLIDAVRSAARN